jgi:hypothetical protein
MTKEDIIRFAQQAGLDLNEGKPGSTPMFLNGIKRLVQFAFLVADNERDELMKMIEPSETDRYEAAHYGTDGLIELQDQIVQMIRQKGDIESLIL